MLLRFTVENMFSFRGCETLDLTAVRTCKERIDEASIEKNYLNGLYGSIPYILYDGRHSC